MFFLKSRQMEGVEGGMFEPRFSAVSPPFPSPMVHLILFVAPFLCFSEDGVGFNAKKMYFHFCFTDGGKIYFIIITLGKFPPHI